MSTDMERSSEIELLRERLEEYERAFESAAPRLAAFKKLEEIAREQKTSPEAVASQAALDVLVREEAAAKAQVDDLHEERDALSNEVSLLLIEKSEKEEAMTIIQGEHDALASEVAELMAEIESIRLDAIRLMKERTQLQAEVEALRNETEATAASVAAENPVSPGSVAHGSDLTFSDDADGDDAFNRFFDAETGKDKARDWMLG